MRYCSDLHVIAAVWQRRSAAAVWNGMLAWPVCCHACQAVLEQMMGLEALCGGRKDLKTRPRPGQELLDYIHAMCLPGLYKDIHDLFLDRVSS